MKGRVETIAIFLLCSEGRELQCWVYGITFFGSSCCCELLSRVLQFKKHQNQDNYMETQIFFFTDYFCNRQMYIRKAAYLKENRSRIPVIAKQNLHQRKYQVQFHKVLIGPESFQMLAVLLRGCRP